MNIFRLYKYLFPFLLLLIFSISPYALILDKAEAARQDNVTICHYPPGHTITVTEAAVEAHLGHGDTLGACPEDQCGEEDPGICLQCKNGKIIPDNSEDPGTCQKCQGGRAVPDNSEDPGLCQKCEGGSSVPDNLEDPGLCQKCEAGNVVPDDSEDPGICYKCSGGISVPDDFEVCSDGDVCTINDRCQGGTCTGDIDPSPVDPNCQ